MKRKHLNTQYEYIEFWVWRSTIQTPELSLKSAQNMELCLINRVRVTDSAKLFSQNTPYKCYNGKRPNNQLSLKIAAKPLLNKAMTGTETSLPRYGQRIYFVKEASCNSTNRVRFRNENYEHNISSVVWFYSLHYIQ